MKAMRKRKGSTMSIVKFYKSESLDHLLRRL